MNFQESQVGTDNFSLDGINYILFKPFSEKYYQYNINSLDENGHLLERLALSKFFVKQYISLVHDVIYLSERFKSFIFLVEKSQVIEVTPDQENLDEETKKILATETAKGKIEEVNPVNNLQTKWEGLFGKGNARIREIHGKLFHRNL